MKKILADLQKQLLELSSEFHKVIQYEVNIQKSTLYQYTVSPLYPQIPYLQIQPTVNKKYLGKKVTLLLIGTV